MTATAPVRRTVDRVRTKTLGGPTEQVDRNALVIAPNEVHNTDPFLLMAEDWFSTPGFEWHPHRGLETVTVVLDGKLEHGDSLGHAGALEPGDIQWMTAGSGIIHRELAYHNEFAHTLQLWLNLPGDKRMVDTRYQDLRRAEQATVASPGVLVRVVSGDTSGVHGTAETHWPITGLMVTLEPGSSYTPVLPAQDRTFAYVVAGAATIGGTAVGDGQIAWSDPMGGDEPSSLDLLATDPEQPTTLMLFSGKPIREPIVFGGPFVMGSRAEIEQAFADYRRGRFGQVPRLARL
ncbi:pirin family protein [Nocardia sp. 2]|uniref:Pirin family protein n=1 Tax=Nocardia acididurans TaxID=2802282 RepID=A0ABS1M5U0_9NOCA|nr:pirin family protein [Nocardia acididurans]MBL1076018.1 pirin family protein [Nocardia acididurans]